MGGGLTLHTCVCLNAFAYAMVLDENRDKLHTKDTK